MRKLVYYATRAPSAHNHQPWRFVQAGNRLQVWFDRERALPLLDPAARQAHIGIGAALENICVAARGLGETATVRLFPEPGTDMAAEVAVTDGPPPTKADEHLLQAIVQRSTVRVPYQKRSLDPSLLSQLTQTASQRGGRLQVATRPDELAKAAALMGFGDELMFAHGEIQQEVYRWLRFAEQEAEASGDGLLIQTFGLDPLTEKLSRHLLRWEVLRVLNRLGMNRIMGRQTEATVRKSPGVGLLTMPGRDLVSCVEGGRVFQRLALQATMHGVSFQPMSAVPVLTELLREHRHLLPGKQREQAAQLADRFEAYRFEAESETERTGRSESVILLFRLGYAKPPEVREPRREIEDVYVAGK